MLCEGAGQVQPTYSRAAAQAGCFQYSWALARIGREGQNTPAAGVRIDGEGQNTPEFTWELWSCSF